MRVATPTSLQIRQRLSADDPFIGRLAAQAFAEYDGHPALTVRRLVQSGTTWVAWRADALLGFAVVHPLDRDSADLCAIAVEEEARGLGIGRALLTHVERAVVSAGMREIRLHTAQSNLAALELFLKCGFRLQQRMPRFYRGMYDACALSKLVGTARSTK
ncbi:MAG TPA: GNAT family N-acetyltransferase [Polyangiaceae bacterium]|nr:GNAT family N-acetyltransferase [Polyangiaceae bacterium]